MKKLTLLSLLCLISTMAQANQQDDINLCKSRILTEYGERVSNAFNIGEKCNNNTWVFDSWERFFCQVDRKSNRIYIGKLPYNMEKRKYSGNFECLAVAVLVTQAVGDHILDPKLEKSHQNIQN